MSHRDLKNRVYAYKADTGQSLWLLSNGDNEETVLLTMGGLRNASTLLPGNMSTLHDTASAQQLMRWFLSSLKQMGFIKIEAWWLGREALAMLKGEKRLATVGEQSPPDFDLKWSQVDQNVSDA